MEKKSQVLTIIFAIIVTVSVVLSYNKYILREDVSFDTDEALFQQALLEE